MDKVMRVLRFLRLTDADNNLSLTNVAILVTLVALVLKPGVSVADVVALVAALASYQAKRWMGANSPDAGNEAAEVRAAIADLQSKVTGLQLGQSLTQGLRR